ncbi:MAG: thymidylate synthase [Bacilli bacterium]|nr:thymidylate synthase [Bacilli bacterium]
MYAKVMMDKIMQDGAMDLHPRPHYEDGEPAHTLSINGGALEYDLSKGESPLQTLRPIAVKYSISELLWIYQDASNDLDLLASKYGVNWWDQWDVGDRTIGFYGASVKKYDLMNKLLTKMEKNPDGRDNIINLLQEELFEYPYRLKPCAYLTTFNVRHDWDGKDYLDMSLKQRSSDFATAGCINQMQYVILQCLVARHLGMEPGKFTWQYDNVQLYDRHLDQAIEMMWREPITCNPKVIINPEKTNFYDMEVSDIKIEGYPRELIKTKNPQLKFPLGI